jgi:succinate-semialdehyde dehydrogenase/glutarate-semialdehyde dehydrogenase
MGSLLSPAQLATVTRHVEDARAKGATVLAGGRPRPDLGPLFYEPTVLEGVTPAMACRDEETFGPVVAVYRVASDDEAVTLANDTPYGLNASVWTRDVRRGRSIGARIQAGTVNVNEGYAASFGSIDAPMGGMRKSGLGRRQGPDGIHRYTDQQAIATQRVLPIAPAFGMSDGAYVKAMTGVLRVLKAVRRP